MADPLKVIGIIMIVIGGIILLSAFPMVLQSTITVGPLEITDVSPISATRIVIGVIGIILGLVIYFGKEGLKLFIGEVK